METLHITEPPLGEQRPAGAPAAPVGRPALFAVEVAPCR
jgi:hypothetical protein